MPLCLGTLAGAAAAGPLRVRVLSERHGATVHIVTGPWSDRRHGCCSVGGQPGRALDVTEPGGSRTWPRAGPAASQSLSRRLRVVTEPPPQSPAESDTVSRLLNWPRAPRRPASPARRRGRVTVASGRSGRRASCSASASVCRVTGAQDAAVRTRRRLGGAHSDRRRAQRHCARDTSPFPASESRREVRHWNPMVIAGHSGCRRRVVTLTVSVPVTVSHVA